MIATAIRTVLNALLRCWLRLEAWELAHWLRDLERDGLSDSLHIRSCRRRMAEIEVQLATLQPPLRRAREVSL